LKKLDVDLIMLMTILFLEFLSHKMCLSIVEIRKSFLTEKT
jgi:hypothetical protein